MGGSLFLFPSDEIPGLATRQNDTEPRDNLSRADLKPIDLYLSAFGPALRGISEHRGAERETRNPQRPQAEYWVTPTDALQAARREVSHHRAQEISREWAGDPADQVLHPRQRRRRKRYPATLEALIRTTKPSHDDHQSQRCLWQFLYAESPPEVAGVQGTLI